MYSERVVELFEKFSPTLDLAGAVALVSCVKSKLRKAAPARELYSRSPWFRTARKIVEASGVRWFILSAKHGLIAPDRVTAPYDATLKEIGRAGRQVWAGRVLKELLPALEGERRVVVFASREYREFLIAPMRDAGIAVDVPMAHLRQFEQKPWLAEQLRRMEARAALKSAL
jgi:Family of unknown function (DUF6884)